MGSIKVLGNKDLEKYVICPKCNTLYIKEPLPPGKRAVCKNCGALLYLNDPGYVDKALALSISGLMFFVLANMFPLVKIDYFGNEQYIIITEAIKQLAENGFYIVAFAVVFMVLIIPAIVLIDYIMLLILLKIKKGEPTAKKLLILLAKLIPWSMMDIFAISVLVSLVKLVGEVEIFFGTSFWALVLYVAIDMYLLKVKKLGYLWDAFDRIYHADK